MSRKHPIIAVTGSSGAGTTTVKGALEQILRRVGAQAEFVEGDSFHRYNRNDMKKELKLATWKADKMAIMETALPAASDF